jgi:hypothetical protein
VKIPRKKNTPVAMLVLSCGKQEKCPLLRQKMRLFRKMEPCCPIDKLRFPLKAGLLWEQSDVDEIKSLES